MGRQSRDLPPGKATEEEDAPFLGTSKRPSTIVCSMAARNPTLLLLQVSIFLFVCALLVLVSALTQHATDRECFQRLNVNCKFYPVGQLNETDHTKLPQSRRWRSTKRTLPTSSCKRAFIAASRLRSLKSAGQIFGKLVASLFPRVT
jgi:hypothetical protein